MKRDVKAEVVSSKRPEVPKCPEMWVRQSFQFGGGWTTEPGSFRTRPAEHTFKPTRIVRIPGEGEPAQGDGLEGSVERLCRVARKAASFIDAVERIDLTKDLDGGNVSRFEIVEMLDSAIAAVEASMKGKP